MSIYSKLFTAVDIARFDVTLRRTTANDVDVRTPTQGGTNINITTGSEDKKESYIMAQTGH